MVRVRGVVTVLLLVLALPLFAQTRTRPPRDLHRIGDHWTAYYPPDPATYPPGARVHTIVRGDTLWDLARTYYGNPYLWPQLWEANTYITDAHWIYPGDPLLVPGESVTGDIMTETTVGSVGGSFDDGDAFAQTLPETSGRTDALLAAGTPVPLGGESDVYCWGYLGAVDEPMPNRVAAFEDAQTRHVRGAVEQSIGVGEGDIIFIDGGASTGLVAGETYLVVMPGEVIYRPESRQVIGRHYDFRGRVRILCTTDNSATAIVTQSCHDIHVGDRLKPFPQLPIPLARMTPMATICSPPSGKVSGQIVNAKDYRFALGEGALVEIDLGRDDLVQPGDFLTIYREAEKPGIPRLLLGEVGILTAEARTATGKIVRSRYDIRVGDRVELK